MKIYMVFRSRYFDSARGPMMLLRPEADLEGACEACTPPPPLKFAKHMLYNVN